MLCSLAFCSTSLEAPARTSPQLLPPDWLGALTEDIDASEAVHPLKTQAVSHPEQLRLPLNPPTNGEHQSPRFSPRFEGFGVYTSHPISPLKGRFPVTPLEKEGARLKVPLSQVRFSGIEQPCTTSFDCTHDRFDGRFKGSATAIGTYPNSIETVSWRPSPDEASHDKTPSPQWSEAHRLDQTYPSHQSITRDLPNSPEAIAPVVAPNYPSIPTATSDQLSDKADRPSSAVNALPPEVELTQTFSDPNDGLSDDDFLNPDLENTSLNPEDVESELGEIRIIQPRLSQPRPRRRPFGQLLLRSSAFTSSNITGLEDFQESDIPLTNSATLLLTPKLGPQTTLVAAAGYGLSRFPQEGDSNYDFLNLSVGVQQQLNRATYAQLGWVQRQLYSEDSGSRLLRDNSLRLIIGRQDRLADKLRLDSFYEFRARFTDPNDRNRIGNTLGANLRYTITPKLTSFLGYQLALNDFTRVARFDTRHQIRASTTYSINRIVFVGGFLSYLFGTSSDSAIDPENFSAGLSLGINIPFF